MPRTTLSEYSRNGLTAVYRKDDDTDVVELVLVPTGLADAIVRDDCAAEPLVQAKIVGDDYPFGFSQGRTMRNSATVRAMRFTGQNAMEKENETVVTTTLEDPHGYVYTHTLRIGEDSRAAEITTGFANRSAEPVTLEMLSSFTLGSLSPLSRGLAPETLRIHRLRSTWSAEGRLVSEPAEDEQLEPSWQKFSANSVRFGSVGSFPVREYVPFVGVEDTEHGVTWAAATTHASSWQIELYRRDYGLSVSGGIADREFGQWTRVVAPGEAFEAPMAVATVVEGGVDEASQALAGNVRHRLDLPESEADMPVVFNEFCTTWGVPTEKSVDEQIEFLRGKGVKYFVIDAGWFDNHAFEAASRLGSWEVSDQAFPHGLKPVVEKIHAAGMKAGIWFEFEIAGRDDAACFNRRAWLLSRDGVALTSGNRRWWDMRNPEVRAYLAEKVIDFLNANGFDYIKVDYNDTIGIGCETPIGPDGTAAEPGNPASLGDGLYEQIQATQSFFREMKRRVPGLIVEICASGGHRLVQSFMEIGSMASFSDAHECDEIPIIAANMHRMILPRQSQIWAVVKHDQPLSKLYYQVASGLLGRLCFSGDTGSLRDEQAETIAKAVAWYAKAAPVIDHGVSEWRGPKVVSYRHPRGWQAIVRRGEEKAEGRALAVLHTFHDGPEAVDIPVGEGFSRVDDVWARPGVDVSFDAGAGALRVCGLRDFDGVGVLLG
ncbi:glycoside hydrolase family 36 protein [Bifidobacterium avesanii]|uniref:Alpha-galactosidase n=1 Tax=Bifidobacterium avesanii TaxID=1798157 RepID=A0A7K3TIA8_9BIFI|nr:glycoside hydrolase family 36 protein [Bifidobacterium avesanii]KAB8291036.1 alpha-galactosidase [Bifidobacterium avesanii]NEG78802.1 alpha-galactosidase [Bifidobacterium avesanii]